MKPKAHCVLALHVFEPNSRRARELLAAIASRLGLQGISLQPGQDYVLVPVSMEWEGASYLARDALAQAGDEGQSIVRVLPPP